MACCCCSSNTCKTILFSMCIVASLTSAIFLRTKKLEEWEGDFLSAVATMSLVGSTILYVIERLENRVKKPAPQAISLSTLKMACCCCSSNTCKTILFTTCVVASLTSTVFLRTKQLEEWEGDFFSAVATISLVGSTILYVIERLENRVKKPAPQAPPTEIPMAMPRENLSVEKAQRSFEEVTPSMHRE